MKKGIRNINVNLWDDYCQKPEYPFNSPTSICIESRQKLKNWEIGRMREIIFERCLNWKKWKDAKNVEFSKNESKDWRIDIMELDEYSRKDLYSYLKKDDKAFEDIRINWLMES